ncbi:alpha/beta hydrolase [Actinoplanes sp. NPDC023801]|uniref:alpha/beta fold hydrolase n=1 Tax=Actinoplanes sp. NPDC023801 TaxID=3154595 RepID=UPI0033EC473C
MAADGTRIAYRSVGTGRPLVCHPGGPGRSADYLGDLGGLAADRRLVLVDPRGTGGSQTPVDPGTYRCSRLAEDLEALRLHLGLERFDLLGHSAGANVALAYAAAYPSRLDHLVLLTPSRRLTGAPDDLLTVAARYMTGEPWYPDAVRAAAALDAGDTAPGLEERMEPLLYGRWDPTLAAHAARGAATVNPAARDGFHDPGLDPDALRRALAALPARSAVIAGERDGVTGPVAPGVLASWLPGAQLIWLPGGGHFPWLVDPAGTREAIDAALRTVAPVDPL